MSIGLMPRLPFINIPIQIKLGKIRNIKTVGFALLINREEIIN
tara:strand:- start:150 stop:278 length:129 start_codon:yes stop_codon:yes gene_type:complete